jgi:hypothetical protein
MKDFQDHLKAMRSQGANVQQIIQESPPTSALGQLNAIAQSIRAARPLLSEAQAFGAALASRPDLYQAYKEEAGLQC